MSQEAVVKPVELEWDGPIARVRFNRPAQLNAIDAAMARAFLDTCQLIARSTTARVVVLSGNGRAFVAGGDLAALQQDCVATATSVIEPINEAMLILDALPQPVIGGLHGAVAGAGVGLALACDFAIAAENTQFNLAYARIGACLDAGSSWFLARTVGLRRALELSLRSPTFTAADALQWGIVNQVVAPGMLDATVDALATELAAGPTFAYGRIKRLLKSAHAQTLAEQLAAEQAAFCECAATEDFSEGIKAFLGKCDPAFQGR